MNLNLEDNQMCYACGKNNPHGLKLTFLHPRQGALVADVVFSEEHQGFKGIVHGGMMALVLDEMMVNLTWKEGISAVTAELAVRLKKPTLVGETVHLEGRIERQTPRAVFACATATNTRGEVLASASATCLRIKLQNSMSVPNNA